MAEFQEQIQFEVKEDALWMAVYTHPLHEKRLLDYLKVRNIPVYLPLVPEFKIHNVVKDGKSYSYRQEVLRPMLKSYLFARLTEAERKNIWASKSVNKLLQVPPEQQAHFIEELRGLRMMEQLARSSAKIEFKKEIQVHDRFVIESPKEFEGTYGYLVEKKKRFLWVIKIDILGQFVDVEIDPGFYKMTKVN